MEWEYHCTILRAERRVRREPPISQLPLYAPELLKECLNELGAQGWELVSATPHLVGNNHDINLARGIGSSYYTHDYLCIFKRPKP